MDTYKQMSEVNLWGTIRVTKAVLPLIRRAKGQQLENNTVHYTLIAYLVTYVTHMTMLNSVQNGSAKLHFGLLTFFRFLHEG